MLWRPEVSNAVLPVQAQPTTGNVETSALNISWLECRVAVVRAPDGTQHILFANGARRLQLAATGSDLARAGRLMTDAVAPPKLVERRLLLIRQLSTLIRRGDLPTHLHPPDPRSARLGFILRVLDGSLATASQRDIAEAIIVRERVNADWTDPRDHLRDRLRRAVRRGSRLTQLEYLRLLR